LCFKEFNIAQWIWTQKTKPKETLKCKIWENNEKTGIVIIDENTMEGLDDYTKELVVSSISPVFVVVSETTQQDELRKMIIQSIGVDLMKDEE